MPSPFPGMDPYLESPDWFPCLHDGLIFCIQELLQQRLPEAYFAQTTQMVWVDASGRYIEPDAEVLLSRRKSISRERETGGVALAEFELANPIEVLIEPVEDDLFEESFIEIRRRQKSENQLVTVIEILSLSNKTRGNAGRRKYLDKQEEILKSQVHLVEIDLLRGGEHTTAVPRVLADNKAGPFDYHICVRRGDRANVFFVYPILLEERLPAIAIPLLPGDPAVPLSLQSVFDKAYDAGPYRKGVDYNEDAIIPPLPAKKSKWVKARLTASA
jgi:Protein of unknown function (DUF4058)